MPLSFQPTDFYDPDALFDRLTEGLEGTERQVVFVVGSPLTQNTDQQDGVLGVNGVIQLIIDFFGGSSSATTLKHRLKDATNAYQEAFRFMSGRRSAEDAQNIVRRAVLNAHSSYDANSDEPNRFAVSRDSLLEIDKNDEGWALRPGVEAIGRLAASAPEHFGTKIVTSNFDPLLQVSLRKAGVPHWTTRLHSDGDPSSSSAEGVHVIHIHGYWIGTDCLHTGTQLTQHRPQLQSWLARQIRGKTVVVMAYGGWDDIFTRSLNSVLSDSGEYPEVIWTFYDQVPSISEHLADILQKGQGRARVSLYSGVDCHDILPKIADYWEAKAVRSVNTNTATGTELDLVLKRLPVSLSPQYADRPPSIDHWVGRKEELDTLVKSPASVIAITGIGGEGKSFLASRYLELVKRGQTGFTHTDWRDCKEQSDTVRTKLLRLVERLSNGDLVADETSRLEDDGLVNLVIEQMDLAEAVVVLDNVDHYVDFEAGRCFGILDLLIQRFAERALASRLIITCRPNVEYGLPHFASFRLLGLSEEATLELYKARSGKSDIPAEKITRLHSATNGHAFWNDILASQLAHHRGLQIDDILKRVELGDVDTPDILMLLWKEMPEREHRLLRMMAETVRPESIETLHGMVGSGLTFAKLNKALKSLQTQNLIVRKVEPNEADLYDLHPLVRTFVRTTNAGAERSGIIKIILNQYSVIIGGIGQMLGVHLPSRLMERYSQRAELEIELKDFQAAFETLDTCADVLIGSGNGEELVRVSRKLFASVDWESASRNNKSFLNIAGQYVEALAYLGHKDDTANFLAQLDTIVPNNTADFIRLCDFKASVHWIEGDFDEGIAWGRKGVRLKEDSGIDTAADCQHNLALCLRDGGKPDEAIDMFLRGNSVEDLLDYENSSVLGNGPLFGNVGRCLQLMGRHEEALVCFHRSSDDIENANGATRTTNRSWLREWIGRSLEAMDKPELASMFYQAARALLGPSYPRRIVTLNALIKDLEVPIETKPLILEKTVQTWLNQERVC